MLNNNNQLFELIEINLKVKCGPASNPTITVPLNGFTNDQSRNISSQNPYFSFPEFDNSMLCGNYYKITDASGNPYTKFTSTLVNSPNGYMAVLDT
jgi:hypothetical protein